VLANALPEPVTHLGGDNRSQADVSGNAPRAADGANAIIPPEHGVRYYRRRVMSLQPRDASSSQANSGRETPRYRL